LRVLARTLMTVAGQAYPPRLENLEALARAAVLPGFRGRTLHGCRVAPHGPGLLICREPAAAAPSLPLPAGRWIAWDGRFLVRARSGKGLFVGALGGACPAAPGIPRLAALTMPAVWAGKRLVAVPSPGLAGGPARGPACVELDGRGGGETGRIPKFSAVFAPPAPLAPPGFAIALAGPRTI
ncbi:MAG: hypothetical protein ACT4N4_11410, partial [Rhodospirillales bacterium]